MTREEAQAVIEQYFRKRVRNDRKIHNAYLLIHSDKLGIHLNIAEGSTGSIPANPQQRYFIASIGKLFTAVLIGVLVEKGLVSYGDAIVQYLDSDISEDLHVYQGNDYTSEIRIKHLLNHTSGLHDYFEDKPKQGRPMLDMILGEPSRFWTPQEIVRWSKEHLKSHFPPGKGFHYSDTGYHLLGLIIERITSRPFHEALRDYIFQPLEMRDSYLIQHSEPQTKSDYPIAGVYFGDTNVINYRSLSCDYAGGGIVSTSEDLLKFMRSLAGHEIIREDTFETMKDWAPFSIGIDYGYGLMNFRKIPIIMPYEMWGNAGSTGSFMFYHPPLDAYLIGSLNQFRYHAKGIRLLFRLLRTLSKCECSQTTS